jgi:3-methyladenine DNA glycosylase AlkD
MKKVKRELRKVSDKERAKNLQWFFKTGKGQYGEGDVFLGIRVPQIREVAKRAVSRVSLEDVGKLLGSKYHEERLAGVLILVEKYKKVDEVNRKVIYDFYLANGKGVNNWDLVDLSAPNIVGNYLLHRRDRKVLYELTKSDNLWERRIAIVSTFAFIRDGQFGDTLKIAKILLKDKHDLIHKAVGWMLREVGKRDEKVLKKFLRDNYSGIPRTSLRYAIERFSAEERLGWLRYRN